MADLSAKYSLHYRSKFKNVIFVIASDDRPWLTSTVFDPELSGNALQFAKLQQLLPFLCGRWDRWLLPLSRTARASAQLKFHRCKETRKSTERFGWVKSVLHIQSSKPSCEPEILRDTRYPSWGSTWNTRSLPLCGGVRGVRGQTTCQHMSSPV